MLHQHPSRMLPGRARPLRFLAAARVSRTSWAVRADHVRPAAFRSVRISCCCALASSEPLSARPAGRRAISIGVDPCRVVVCGSAPLSSSALTAAAHRLRAARAAVGCRSCQGRSDQLRAGRATRPRRSAPQVSNARDPGRRRPRSEAVVRLGDLRLRHPRRRRPARGSCLPHNGCGNVQCGVAGVHEVTDLT